jgi:hypothetical protein
MNKIIIKLNSQTWRIILFVLLLNAGRTLFATIVFTGNQLTFTSEQKTWMHTVQEAGNYQIGVAWIEVKSGDDIPLEVFINKKRVKALYGKLGEVTRFETRLEDLEAGDIISVRISPVESAYRASFTIAFCTPTFIGLPVFNLSDYSPSADGIHDDKTSIIAAVNAAANAGGGIVRFDGSKTYRIIGLNDLTEEYLFELSNVKNVKIEGNGAKLLLHPPDRLLWFKDCENIQIDGFVIDYDPLPYYQGTITNIDVANLTVDIEVPERYPVPQVGNTLDRSKFFGKIFIPDSLGSRTGKGPHLFIESTSRINGAERSIRVKGLSSLTSATDALQQAVDENATEVIVPDFNYGQRGQWCGTIESSSRVMMSNIRFNCMLRQGLMPANNTGPVTFSNVDILTPHPETELFVSWRGHWLAGNNRFGFLIEDGDFDGGCMYDDLFNIYTRLRDITEVISENSIIIGNKTDFDYWKIGDWVSIWTAGEEDLRGMSRIAGLNRTSGLINLESSIPGITLSDIVVNEELMNRGTLVRNCTTTSIGAGVASCRIHTPIHFKDCHFSNAYFWMYSVNTEGSLFEGPRPRDVIFENTYIEGGATKTQEIDINGAWSVYFINTVLDGIRLDIRNSVGVVFDSLAWTNTTRDAIILRENSEAWLFNNSTRNGTEENLVDWMSVDNTSILHFFAPDDYPKAEPPFLEELSIRSPISNETTGVNFYPNPTNDFFLIETPVINKNVNIEIWALTGKMIMEKQLESNFSRIYVDNLSSGVYVLKVKTDYKSNSSLLLKN